jgi:hypothetical protein
MSTSRSQSRVVSFAFAIAILIFLQISPALPGGAPQAAGDNHRKHVDVTFTKWLTTYPAMEGFTGGDVSGVFVGEVLERQVSINPALTSGMIRLEAIYEVQAGRRSFAAMIRGGENSVTGAAVLEGVILAGWRTGDPVRVEFQQKASCVGTAASPCFEGTIHISRASEE